MGIQIGMAKITEYMTRNTLTFKLALDALAKKTRCQGRVTEVFRLTLNYTC